MNTQNIYISGSKYELNVDGAIAAGHLKPITQHAAGQIYMCDSHNHYILCVVGHTSLGYAQVALFFLCDGRRFGQPVVVRDLHNITESEWTQIVGERDRNTFKLAGKSMHDVFLIKK